jgi:hypothetical protein
MFGLFGFGMSPEMEKRQRERERAERAERMKEAVAWDPKVNWTPRLTIKAETWPSWDLFSPPPSTCHDVNDETDESKLVFSPCGRFVFYRKTLKKGGKLLTLSGSREGNVMFDGDVYIPALHEKTRNGERWHEHPWMSVTPMELMTQRPGVRFAKGHTIVGGLGMGWALVQILLKKTVTRVTLVERSQALVDWLLPRVKQLHLSAFDKQLDIVVGDAYEVIPAMTADVAVIDIFDGYGGNDFLEGVMNRMRNALPSGQRWKTELGPPCPNIGRVWSWGKAEVSDGGW